jgi:hypothetical protein
MSRKNPAPGPVPPGNRPHAGTGDAPPDIDATGTSPPADQGRDPQRRLGNYEGKGESSRVQPGAANDG